MTRSQAAVLLPVIKAFSEGQEIQFRRVPGDAGPYQEWQPLGGHSIEDTACFDAPGISWRVKPSPREWWLCGGCSRYVWGTKQDAISCCPYKPHEPIHVREAVA